MKKIKICLISSAGGHIKELQQLEEFYSKHPHYFVTTKNINTRNIVKKGKTYYISAPSRNLIKFIKNFFQSIKIILKENPDLIISTGAGTALATCYIGKLLNKKIIYIESFCRIKEPSLTGKLVYPISDLFVYQWKYLKKYYPKGKYGGSIF
jgi:beta-1,4-N-acetylglucosaminyltransferase